MIKKHTNLKNTFENPENLKTRLNVCRILGPIGSVFGLITSKLLLVHLEKAVSGFKEDSEWAQKNKTGISNLGDLLALRGSFLWKICWNNKFKSSGDLFCLILV